MNTFTFDSPRIQNFSIPNNIIYYVNRSTTFPNGLEKLQQNCKYFFAKNKLVILENGIFTDSCWPKFSIYKDVQKIANFDATFLLLGELYITLWKRNYNITKTLCSKIYQNNITSFKIRRITLNLSEFEIISASKFLKNVVLDRTTILDDEGNDITIDEILKRTRNITKFFCSKCKIKISEAHTITNKTLKNLTTILKGNSIVDFGIAGFILSPTLDQNLFCSFIKNVATPKSDYYFTFYRSFPNQKEQIKAAVGKMIEKWDIKDKPRIIF